MKLLGSTENKMTRVSRVLYTFVLNKSFGSLLEISPKNHIFLKTFNSEFQEIEVRFTDQNSQPLEIEEKINLTLIIKQRSFAKNISTHATKVAKNMSNKHSQKLLGSTKKSTTDAIKTASKRAIQNTAEATGDIIGNKIADRITSISKSPKEFHSQYALK